MNAMLFFKNVAQAKAAKEQFTESSRGGLLVKRASTAGGAWRALFTPDKHLRIMLTILIKFLQESARVLPTKQLSENWNQ